MSAADEVVEIVALEGWEIVCEICWLVYNGHLEECTNCAFWGDPE